MIFRYNLFTILWAALMLLGTMLPSSSLPKVTPAWYIIKLDTVVHFVMFAILAFLLLVGLHKQSTNLKLRHYAIRYTLLICTAYGILIELAQHLFILSRQGDIRDVLANTAGCLFGIIIFKWIYTW